MARPIATLLIALVVALAPACGRKGPLELPPGRAPMPAEDLTAVPGEGAVTLAWRNPVKAVSGRPLGPLGAVEVWVFGGDPAAEGGPLAAGEFERKARLVKKFTGRELADIAAAGAEPPGAMAFTFALPEETAAPAKLAFAVRVFDRAGRASAFTTPVAVELSRKKGGATGGRGRG